MTFKPPRPLRITWLAPDDRGGGVISVAQSCCRQAALAGHDVTLLLALSPTGHAAEFGGVHVESLVALPPYDDIPTRLVTWLKKNPQDVLALNGCEQADVAIPFLPDGTRVVYVVHDRAERYFAAGLRNEGELQSIVAVSETVASRIRHRLRDQTKLKVVRNGTVLPITAEAVLASRRTNDLVFLGGDKATKGAYDVLRLWGTLISKGFAGRLHWFGDMSTCFRGLIQRSARAEGIVVHGHQPRRTIFETALQAKVMLMLSTAESFGMATVECMGMGCIPVAWDIETGTKEIATDGEGVFVPLGDYDALVDGVLAALDKHPSCFAEMTTRIRQEFSEAAMWARYETFLRGLMEVAPPERPQAGRSPPPYRPPLRLFQLLPVWLRDTLRVVVGKSPRLGYMLRDFRGR